MDTEKTPQSAVELANEKAKQLSEELKTTVHPIVFKDEESGADIIGFLKEPSRLQKLAVLDKSVMGSFSAAGELLEAILLKEHSDPRIYSERAEDDKIYMGAVMACYNLIKFSANLAKKK